MFNLSRTFRPALLTLLAVASAGVGTVSAQIAKPFAIGLNHARNKPYNFTGRVFSFDDQFTGIASATLIRRHTALTAGHVVFQVGAGFLSRASFTRGLYQNFSIQKVQVASVSALTGYATAAAASTEDSFEAFNRDLGYLVFVAPPVDEDWAVYTTDTTALTDDSGRFVLGYPGVSFDGRTQAYIVPTTPFVELGTVGSGMFENDEYTAEPGMSGGPIYAFRDGVQQIIAETVGGLDDSTGEFNFSIVHATNPEAGQFLASAEYANGLIAKVKITGPATVSKGTTVTFSARPKFAQPRTDGGTPLRPTTDRYMEIQLVSDTVGTPSNPAVTITKVSNTDFQVKFSSSLRSRSTINFTAQYAPNSTAPKSKFPVMIQ